MSIVELYSQDHNSNLMVNRFIQYHAEVDPIASHIRIPSTVLTTLPDPGQHCYRAKLSNGKNEFGKPLGEAVLNQSLTRTIALTITLMRTPAIFGVLRERVQSCFHTILRIPVASLTCLAPHLHPP